MGAATKPNIVLVIADDLGFNGVGYRNPELRTPNLDRLASSGARIEDFYTDTTCAPARASLLTGRFSFKLLASLSNFAYFQAEEGTHLGYTLLPEHLRQMGYSTCVAAALTPCSALFLIRPCVIDAGILLGSGTRAFTRPSSCLRDAGFSPSSAFSAAVRTTSPRGSVARIDAVPLAGLAGSRWSTCGETSGPRVVRMAQWAQPCSSTRPRLLCGDTALVWARFS